MKASLVAPLTATYEGQLAYKSLQNRQNEELFLSFTVGRVFIFRATNVFHGSTNFFMLLDKSLTFQEIAYLTAILIIEERLETRQESFFCVCVPDRISFSAVAVPT